MHSKTRTKSDRKQEPTEKHSNEKRSNFVVIKDIFVLFMLYYSLFRKTYNDCGRD